MSATPFNLDRLEKISLCETRLHETMAHIIPQGEDRLTLLRSIEKTLQQAIRGGLTLHPKPYRLEAMEAWMGRLLSPGIFAMFSTLPTSAKMFMVWDPVLVLSLIDRLLGGELNEVPKARPLSEIETGVFSFLLMQVARAFHQFQSADQSGTAGLDSVGKSFAPIRIERIFSDPQEIKAILKGAERVISTDITVAIPELSGEVQLVLPDIFIEEILMPRVPQKKADIEPDQIQKRLEALGNVVFPSYASLGEAKLSTGEVSRLEVGDIVLIDRPHARLEDGKIRGDIVLYPQHREAPTFLTSIVQDGPPLCLKIERVYKQA